MDECRLGRGRMGGMDEMNITGSEFHLIPDTGHTSYIEEYRRFNDVLDGFSKRAFGSSEWSE